MQCMLGFISDFSLYLKIKNWFFKYRPVARDVMLLSLEREVWDSNLGPVKSNTELPTARHRCYISSKEAVLPGRNDVEMGSSPSDGPRKLITRFSVVQRRVVNGPISLGPNPDRTRKYKPEPGPNPKINLKLKSCPKKPESWVRSEKLAMLLNYFEYIFVHLRQKSKSQSQLSPTFLSTLGPNPNPTRKARPDLQLWYSEYDERFGLIFRFYWKIHQKYKI